MRLYVLISPVSPGASRETGDIYARIQALWFRFLFALWQWIQYIEIFYNNGNYFRLIKVKDSNRAVCVAMRNGGKDKERYSGVTSNVDISKIGNGKIEGGEPIDLLPSDGGNNLALYDFYVSKPAVSASEDNMFYSVSFVLGTTSGGADILAKGNSCAAPKDMVSGSSNYCAINKFNFAMQVNGGK